MVEEILAAGPVSAPVEAALRAVPRHRFLPDLPVEEAYADRATAGRGAGRWAPSPSTLATMLDQLGVLPGDRVLEVGAADGYSTALIAELTGPSGVVVSTDVEPVSLRGYCGDRSIVVAADLQARPHAPFSRVLAHAGVNLRPALIDEVSEGGRIVIPLRLRGLDRTVSFVCDHGRLISQSIRPIHMGPRGARRTAAILAGGVRLDATGHDVDARKLRHALCGERHLIPTGVTLPADLLAGLDLWLAIIRQTYGRLASCA
uniref:Protein-L-isoaspartate O-methyltransferase n=1 Tax=Parafrankia colletiae TaxID=573497 RepID=A0A1S1QSA9_9ACTN